MSDASPWDGRLPVAAPADVGARVTLVEGQTFCLSAGRTGDIASDYPDGLFVLDTRVLSRWELRVNGHRLEPGLPAGSGLSITVEDGDVSVLDAGDLEVIQRVRPPLTAALEPRDLLREAPPG